MSRALLTWSSEGLRSGSLRFTNPSLGNAETMESCAWAAKKLWGIQLQIFTRGMETIRLIPGTSSGFPFSCLVPIQLPSPFLLPFPRSRLTHSLTATAKRTGHQLAGHGPGAFFHGESSPVLKGTGLLKSSFPFILAITKAAILPSRISVPLTYSWNSKHLLQPL